jgi:CBS domain-containing protein
MITVNQILQTKGNRVYTVAPEATVFEALQIMAEKNVGALVVTRNDEVAGIFSERDYARKIVLHGKTSRETRVQEIMTVEVKNVTPDASVTHCMELMTDKHIRHLPVLDDGRLMGIISIGDAVKSIINEQQNIIHHLEGYITGQT